MKIAVALDLPTPNENQELANKLGELPPEIKQRLAFKVGFNTYVAAGPTFLGLIKAVSGVEVVLDLKLFDIPNTMANTAKRIAELGVDLFTVHASAGAQALQAVHKAIHCPDFQHRPKMLAVTVLTSMDKPVCESIYKRSTYMAAKHLLGEALHGNADGIVCSPIELPFLNDWAEMHFERQGPIPKFIRFVPGIELLPRKDDQKRKGGLKEVVEGKADYVVIGRPIYQSPDPAATVTKLVRKIDAMKSLREQYDKEATWEST